MSFLSVFISVGMQEINNETVITSVGMAIIVSKTSSMVSGVWSVIARSLF